MINNPTLNGDYWAVDFNNDRNRVLIQLIEGFDIARIALSKQEAERFLEKLKCTLDFIKD